VYRGDGETEIKSEGHVIQIGRDITGDCLITSGDVPRGPELYLECHGYDKPGDFLMNVSAILWCTTWNATYSMECSCIHRFHG